MWAVLYRLATCYLWFAALHMLLKISYTLILHLHRTIYYSRLGPKGHWLFGLFVFSPPHY
jgi:hypothetical protein